jgi:hypothetical protein
MGLLFPVNYNDSTIRMVEVVVFARIVGTFE